MPSRPLSSMPFAPSQATPEPMGADGIEPRPYGESCLYTIDLRWWRAMKLGLLSVVVLGVVVVAAGCGGGKKAASSTSTSAATTTSTRATTTESKKAAAPTFASAHNCLQLAALGAKVAKSLQPTGGDFAATAANEGKLLQAMASAAPSEIRADFETFVSAFNDYARAIQKAGFKPGATPTAAQVATLEAATKSFSTAKLQKAEQHLSAWASKNCGGLTTTTG